MKELFNKPSTHFRQGGLMIPQDLAYSHLTYLAEQMIGIYNGKAMVICQPLNQIEISIFYILTY